MFPYITVFGRVLTTYGICMTAAFFLVSFLSIRRGIKHNIPWEGTVIVCASAIGMALVGGCLLYILVTYSFNDIVTSIKSGNFSFISNGGIVFYGGLVGGILGAMLGSKIAKIKLSLFDEIIVPYLPLGHAIGRIGCLLAGCCYGMAYDGLFAVHYKNSIFGLSPGTGYFPVQLVESFLNVCLMIILLIYSRIKRRKYDVLFAYLLLYAVIRFATEFLRGDSIRGIYLGLSTSQWVSVTLIIICLLRQLFIRITSSKKL